MMSRRPAAPPMGRINTARARMAPGGRMWSESPIRAPRRRVAMSGVPIPAAPPTAAKIGEIANTHLAGVWQVPDFDGNTSALTLVCYHGGFESWNIPTDWDLIDQGTGGDTSWRLYAQTGITAIGTPEAIDYNMASGGNGYLAGYYAFFYGDSGQWDVSKGTMTYDGTRCGFQPPPGTPPAWLQMGMIAHPWTGFGSPDGVDIVSFVGTVGAYCYPGPGTYDTAAWAAAMARDYYDEAVDGYVTYSANGVPSEQPIAAFWTP